MRNLVILTGIFCLAACTVGPDYKAPAPPVNPAWNDLSKYQDSTVSTNSNPDPLWWNQFNDPVLSLLITRAIAGNPDLQEALLRVVEAHQNEIATAAAGLPTLNGNASYMREQLGLKGLLESHGAYADLNKLADGLNQYSPTLGKEVATAGPVALNSLAGPVNLYQYGLSSSWELDLFGKVRRSVEQAKATTEAQQESANDALVMLESQVAQAYFQLRGAQALEQQQQKNIRIAQEQLRLTQNRQQQGLATDLDVAQAGTELDNEQSQINGYDKQNEQAIDQINLLLGEQPGTMDALLSGIRPLPAVPKIIGVGVPAELARRRPDIREAEAELHAATAGVGIAVARFYPDISLTGSAGLRATDGSYLTNWASLFYSAGPTISLPIFEGGTLVANLKTARAEQAAAALNYRATVLSALREVEDALIALRTDRSSRDQTAATEQAAEFEFYLSNNRFTHGLSSYLQVLDSERSLVSAREQLAQANVQLATDAGVLYTSLGGGWTNTPVNAPKVTAVPPPLPAAADSVAGQ